MDNILIATSRDDSQTVEALLQPMNYVKKVGSDEVYFSLQTDDWDHPNNPIPLHINNHLIGVIGEHDYAFVRMNQEVVGDIEYHGNLPAFNVNIHQGVTIDE
jgi:hypothetical protein